jgi:uncharacterized protein YndB with AHSA1/START domain
MTGSTEQQTETTRPELTVEAVADLPMIRVQRDFAATPEQLFRAHTDPELFARWVGPEGHRAQIDHWDARTGGSYRYRSVHEGTEYAFRGCFHTVRPDRLVQTFTWEGMPDAVTLDTMWFEDLGEGRTRLHVQTLLETFEARAGMLSMGMEAGLADGYAKLDAMLAEGAV